MTPFVFSGVGTISFGTDRIEQIGDEISALTESKNVVLISDAGVAKAGLVERVKSILDRSGYDVTVFSELKGEPKAGTVDDAAAVVRRCKTPCVIGLGGGSALDVAKLASVIVGSGKPAEDYALCAHPLPRPALKRILIPTTAGTGSEVTRTAIFTAGDGRKVWAWGNELRPDVVLLDPTLTVSVPAYVTAASGVDALVHAIEACTCRNKNPVSDALGLHAIRLAAENLITAIEAPRDIEARSGMLLSSTLAGAAFASTGTAVAHAIGHALATIAEIPHGHAVAIGMYAVLDWNISGAPGAHAAVAEALGASKKPASAVSAFKALMDQTGLNRSLADKHIDPETLAIHMCAIENKPMLDNNARAITRDDALALARLTVGLS